MSQLSSEWKRYIGSVSPSESRFGSSISGRQSPIKREEKARRDNFRDDPFGIPEEGKHTISDGSDIPSEVHTSELLASPSGPPPGVQPHTLRKENKHYDLQKRDRVFDAVSVNTPPDLLIHTDHTGLSELVAVSIPYYNISNYSQLVNTFSMLARRESKRARLKLSSSAAHTELNQVPPRFSQFILDQTTLHPRSSVHQERRELRRDISDLMGSQATIFSTKPEEAQEKKTWLRNRKSGTMKKSKGGPSKGSVYSDEKSSVSLQRKKAVRYTGMRRVQVFLRQLYYRFKRRFFSFSAGPKKASSTVRRRTLVRKQRLNPKNRSIRRNLAQISNPLENPVFSGADRVEHLTDDLKRSAGAPISDPVDLCNEKLGKYNHLSNYLDEQRQLSMSPNEKHHFPTDHLLIESVLDTETPPPPPPHRVVLAFSQRSKELPQVPDVQDPFAAQQLQNTWKAYLSNVVLQRIRLRQEIFLFQTLLANEPVPAFLRSDISSILLRHSTAIGRGEADTKETEMKNENAEELESTMQLQKPPLESNTTRSVPMKPVTSVSSVKLTEPFAKSISSVSLSESFHSLQKSLSSDEDAHEFQKVLNRRSMLGDMLNYDSEEFDSDATETLAFFSESASESAKNHKLEQYGVSRHSTMRNTERSSVYSYSIQGSLRLMTRSPGINSNLCGKN